MNGKQFVIRACFWFLACAAAGASSTAAPEKPASISIESTGEPMRSLIPRIGEAAGQRIVSGPHSADRRFFLFVRERPLPEVMGQLRRFIAFKPGGAFWFREGSGSVLDEDLASMRARQRAGEKRKRDLYRRALNQLEEFTEWTREQPEDRPGQRNYKIKCRRYLGLFRSLPATVQRETLSGRSSMIPVTSLSGETRRLMTDMGLFRTGISYSGKAARGEWIPHLDLLPEQVGSRSSLRVTLRTDRSGGPTFSDILNPPRWILPEGAADHGYLRTEYRARRHGPEAMDKISSLQKTILLRGGEGWTVEKTLSEFSLQSGLPLLGEYDPCYFHPGRAGIRMTLTGARTGPAWKALEEICS